MQTNLKYGPFILCLLISYNVLAQDFELVKIESAHYPQQSIEESSADGEVGFREWSVQFAIPQLLKNKNTILIHQLGYRNLKVDVIGSFTNTSENATNYYHTISYNLSLVQTLSPTWKLLLSFNPTLASDFSGSLNEEDFLFQASGIAMKTKNSNFSYGFGLAYNTRFGRQIVIPMGMIRYDNQKITLDLVVPNKLSAMFNTNKALHYGLEATLDGGLFNNTSETPIANTLLDEVGYSRLNIGPNIAFKLNQAIKISLTGGMAVGRRLEFIDASEETSDRTPVNGPFFKVGLAFVPNRAKVAAATNTNRSIAWNN